MTCCPCSDIGCDGGYHESDDNRDNRGNGHGGERHHEDGVTKATLTATISESNKLLLPSLILIVCHSSSSLCSVWAVAVAMYGLLALLHFFAKAAVMIVAAAAAAAAVVAVVTIFRRLFTTATPTARTGAFRLIVASSAIIADTAVVVALRLLTLASLRICETSASIHYFPMPARWNHAIKNDELVTSTEHPNVGALIIRIRFSGIVCYKYNTKPPE